MNRGAHCRGRWKLGLRLPRGVRGAIGGRKKSNLRCWGDVRVSSPSVQRTWELIGCSWWGAEHLTRAGSPGVKSILPSAGPLSWAVAVQHPCPWTSPCHPLSPWCNPGGTGPGSRRLGPSLPQVSVWPWTGRFPVLCLFPLLGPSSKESSSSQPGPSTHPRSSGRPMGVSRALCSICLCLCMFGEGDPTHHL